MPTPTTLEQVVATALDPAYTRRAARCRDRPGADDPGADDPGGEHPGRERRRHGRLRGARMPLALLLIGLLVALTARQAAESAPARERLRVALGDAYETRTADRTTLAGDVRELAAAVGGLRERQRAADDLWDTATARIAALAVPAGLAAARGPGVRVTLTDPPGGPSADAGNPRPAERAADSRLADHDLADMVNLLWSAGAEAVAVNGVRLTGLSAVRAAGEVILVGLSPVEAPYVVEAIGDPAGLVARVASAAATIRLRTRVGAPPDAVVIARVDEVSLPAGPDPNLRYARGSGS
ncbi:DUF881 domain-containing protein [Frankia sp. EI5c]|uniref:DUF881 domain-containing protein n=1 Tax=Frankia sp. EI5c TaxID=683316 RepID=UPI001F5BC0A2|nr:DUF881 domain-containing protein [Frankia sp. EI5c]